MNPTHDPKAKSWLASANTGKTDFPIQNLPFSVFRRTGSNETYRGGVAIGDAVIDLAALHAKSAFAGNAIAQNALAAASKTTLNEFMSMGNASWSALRQALFAALLDGAKGADKDAIASSLVLQSDVTYAVPTHIQDYTDFYTSVYHAANIGKLFRGGDDPLTPNFRWLPIAYHGRASSISVSGQDFHRPMGQFLPPPSPGSTPAPPPIYGPCRRLDYELELGIYIGPGNRQGDQIALANAEDHVFGICLLNDWSARDIQSWEYVPLGPFLGKNFATTISPWIVTMEALEPFRAAWDRPSNEPQPLAYLEHASNRASGGIDIQLAVDIESKAHRAASSVPAQVSLTSFKHQYWTIAQMVAQHTVNGCNLQPGDLLGSGTISGPTPSEAGALIELSKGGKEPITLKSVGAADETRAFLQDGDRVILRGWCEKQGYARIGFGESSGTVLPAKYS